MIKPTPTPSLQNQYIHVQLLEVNTHHSRLLSSLYKLHSTAQTTEDAERIEKAIDALSVVPELSRHFKTAYPLPKMKLR